MTSLDFEKIKILIVGDVMLDRYWWGIVDRISPEAPVPVVKLGRTSVAAGGAANVAANIVGLGASAILVGITGNDAEGETLEKLIKANPLIDSRLIALDDRHTTVKTRIVAHNQHVVRLDQETTEPISERASVDVGVLISGLIEDVDAVVISDYAKGFLTTRLLSEIIGLATDQGKMTFVDPKSKTLTRYHGASVITPNLKEAGEAVEMELISPDSLTAAGEQIRDLCGAKAALITQGEHGMTLFDGGLPFHLDALAQDVFDVTGAGDTVIATLSVAAAAGMGLRDAAAIANIAAGIAVGHIGTKVVTSGEIETFMSTQQETALGA